jgi:hypothetical protein
MSSQSTMSFLTGVPVRFVSDWADNIANDATCAGQRSQTANGL